MEHCPFRSMIDLLVIFHDSVHLPECTKCYTSIISSHQISLGLSASYEIGLDMIHKTWSQRVGSKLICNCRKGKTQQFFTFFATRERISAMKSATCLVFAKRFAKIDLNQSTEISGLQLQFVKTCLHQRKHTISNDGDISFLPRQ